MVYNGHEEIMQSEKFSMSSGANVRIQVKEDSYIVTIDLDSEMYKNRRMNTFKKGIRISSILKKIPREKISKKIVLTRNFTDLAQLSEDAIEVENRFYKMNIQVIFSDFMRPDVKDILKKAITRKIEELSVVV